MEVVQNNNIRICEKRATRTIIRKSIGIREVTEHVIVVQQVNEDSKHRRSIGSIAERLELGSKETRQKGKAAQNKQNAAPSTQEQSDQGNDSEKKNHWCDRNSVASVPLCATVTCSMYQ
mmetsp:Transcript_37964/g.83381  ORF Transcript_37964/g.83381 Transcript_37964/m.83381 type:complete len:119 (-) Transcript_37964:59-415(-)